MKCCFLPTVPPSVKVDNQLVGCPLDESVTLSCFIETYPNSLSYWLRNTEARGAEEMVVKGGFVSRLLLPILETFGTIVQNIPQPFLKVLFWPL